MIKIDKSAVYRLLTEIPRGKVTTYGAIAAALGDPRLARTVGTILHHNPDGVRYPCYKVVNAQGRLAAAYAFGGLARQKALLQADGIMVEGDRVDLKKYLWHKDL